MTKNLRPAVLIRSIQLQERQVEVDENVQQKYYCQTVLREGCRIVVGPAAHKISLPQYAERSLFTCFKTRTAAFSLAPIAMELQPSE